MSIAWMGAASLMRGNRMNCSQNTSTDNSVHLSTDSVDSTSLCKKNMSLSIIKVIFALEARYKGPSCGKNWVHPYIFNRLERKNFEQFYNHVRRFDIEFFGYFRISIKSFYELMLSYSPISFTDALVRTVKEFLILINRACLSQVQ